MEKWEYHVGLIINAVDPAAVSASLNSAGDNGWELVSAIPGTGGLGGPELLTIFKRLAVATTLAERDLDEAAILSAG